MYISKEELIKRIEKVETIEDVAKLKKWVSRTKAVNPVPSGQWESVEGKYGCSACHRVRQEKTPYCPNCGAQMG